MNFKGKDVLSIRDFSPEELLSVLSVAAKFEKEPQRDLLSDTVLCTLFFEPSTRTRLSFESAMSQLGGKVVSFDDVSSSSVMKGESLSDTVKMIEGYCDVIVIRHPKDGSARFVAESAKVPVINGGDGSNQHPTQTFTDLYTLQKALGDIKKTRIGFVGDLKYGRTVHSLALALAKLKLPLTFISPEGLEMPDDLLQEIKDLGVPITQERDLSKAISTLNILYVTRIQKERFSDLLEYERVKGVYQVDLDLLKTNPTIKVMHPLPRLGEIATEVDNTSHALYFQQAHNGIPVRKAIIALVVGKA